MGGIIHLVPEFIRLRLLRMMAGARQWVLGKNVRAVLVQSENGRFLVDAADQKVGRHLAYEGDYASDELNRLISLLRPDSTLLVVGAHIGSMVVQASKRCRRVIAIEANPETWQLLRLNLLINDCTNVEALQVAASDKDEDISFVLNRVNSGGSKRMPLRREYRYYYDSPPVTTVHARALDEMIPEKVDVILMDIEGSEFPALKGMQRLLSGANALLMEFIPNHLKDVSGATVRELVECIAPHFDHLQIPSKGIAVEANQFNDALQEMYDAGESDDGIVFTKVVKRALPFTMATNDSAAERQ